MISISLTASGLKVVWADGAECAWAWADSPLTISEAAQVVVALDKMMRKAGRA